MTIEYIIEQCSNGITIWDDVSEEKKVALDAAKEIGDNVWEDIERAMDENQRVIVKMTVNIEPYAAAITVKNT